MSGKFVFIAGILVSCVVGAFALQCFQCGMYNDGVGSITPCLNESLMKLIECPKKDHKFCIKYISEGSTVKDCVPKCSERENWHSMTYCCNEDGCNSAQTLGTQPFFICFIVIASVIFTALTMAH
ncbi:uncharacterized protein [Diabrotica undecimpunctata]|uniref:uncharacterized protein n=1 Tax=Diabrotica undecimpunctata TaxID=50387 RepID=UPI003B635EDE